MEKQTETHMHKPRPKGTPTDRQPIHLEMWRQSQANTHTWDPRTQRDTHRQTAHPPGDMETEPGKPTHLGPEDPKGHPQTAHPPEDMETEPGKHALGTQGNEAAAQALALLTHGPLPKPRRLPCLLPSPPTS